MLLDEHLSIYVLYVNSTFLVHHGVDHLVFLVLVVRAFKKSGKCQRVNLLKICLSNCRIAKLGTLLESHDHKHACRTVIKDASKFWKVEPSTMQLVIGVLIFIM
jgi:hypothetical protein